MPPPTRHAIGFFALLGGRQRDAELDRSGMINARLAVLPGLDPLRHLHCRGVALAVTPFLDTATC